MNGTQEIALKKLAQAITSIPFNETLGLTIAEVSAHHVSMQFDMKPNLVGNYLHGILHGGVISSVLDMVGGMSVMAGAIHKHSDRTIEELIQTISRCSTVDLQIQYLRPGKGQSFTAEAHLTKLGHKISFTRMQITNQDQVLLATGNGTYLLK